MAACSALALLHIVQEYLFLELSSYKNHRLGTPISSPPPDHPLGVF